jgi:uncharacterized membrane protein YgdD (TMEM256/DUF423 family)
MQTQKLLQNLQALKLKHLQSYFLLFIAGVGDATTTMYALNLGYIETRQFFFPFAATAILSVAIFLINSPKIPVYRIARISLTWGIIFFSFSGFFWNLIILAGLF